MPTPDEPTIVDDAEEVLAGGRRSPVGRYRLDLSTGEWAWSDEVYVMHGFEPGQVVPTTPLMLSHKHPDDRARVDGVLREASNATNVAVREIAVTLVHLISGPGITVFPTREAIDAFLADPVAPG